MSSAAVARLAVVADTSTPIASVSQHHHLHGGTETTHNEQFHSRFYTTLLINEALNESKTTETVILSL